MRQSTDAITAAAEQKALDEGWPIVAVLNHDLMSALAGHPINVTTLDGRNARLRLLTAGEFIERQHALIDEHPERGGTKVTREKAEELTQTLDLFELAGAARYRFGGAS